jgi:hypothetical protein
VEGTTAIPAGVPAAGLVGGRTFQFDVPLPALPALLRSYTFSADAGTLIMRAMHGDSSGVRGAAWLWPISGVWVVPATFDADIADGHEVRGGQSLKAHPVEAISRSTRSGPGLDGTGGC